MRFECAYHGEVPRLYADGSVMGDKIDEGELLNDVRFVIGSPQGNELSRDEISFDGRQPTGIPADLFERVVNAVGARNAEELGLECPECGEQNELVAVVDIP